jgi:predicted Zn-dependent peptidase
MDDMDALCKSTEKVMPIHPPIKMSGLLGRKIIKLLFLLVLLSGCLSAAPQGEISKTVLDNGMVLLLKENRGSEIVAFKLLIGAGLWSEGEDKGIRNFIQQVLLKGTGKRSAEQLALETESLGIQLSASAAEDYADITIVATKERFDEALEILYDVATNPAFSQDEIEKERRLILEALNSREDNPFNAGHDLFLRTLYGTSPYGTSVLGQEETVKKLQRDEFLAFYNENYVPSNMVLTVVGNMNKDKAVREIRKSFGTLEGKKIQGFETLQAVNRGTKSQKTKELAQAIAFIGYPAPEMSAEDYAALKLANTVLGSGMSSRLFQELRDKRGLAYVVGSFYPSRKQASYITAYIGTAPENKDKVVDLIVAEFEKLKKGAPEEEVKKAKMKLIGNFKLNHESNKDQAFYLGWYEIVGRGYEFDEEYPRLVEKATPEDVARVAEKYFNDPVVAVVAP